MNHPVTEMREATGLSKAKFALRIGCTYDQLVRLENGYLARVPDAITIGLARMGTDVEGLNARYQEWREAQAA